MSIDQAGAPAPEMKTPETVLSRYDVIGPIPNPTEIATCPEIKDRWGSLFLVMDEGGEFTKTGVIVSLKDGTNTLDEAQQASLLSVLTPAIKLVDADYRSKSGETTTSMELRIRDYEVPEGAVKADIERMHRDKYDYQYVATIGKSTNLWPGEFDSRDSVMREQIMANNVAPESVASGVLVALDRNTVHGTPDTDPGVAGTRRTFLLFLPNTAEYYLKPLG